MLSRTPPAQQDAVPTVFHINCMGHTTVLILKPIAASLPDTTSFVVRMGHSWQASKPSADLLGAMEQLFDKNHRLRVVDRLPPEHAQWHSHSKFVMKLSSAARDLGEDQIIVILSHDNGDWTDPDL